MRSQKAKRPNKDRNNLHIINGRVHFKTRVFSAKSIREFNNKLEQNEELSKNLNITLSEEHVESPKAYIGTIALSPEEIVYWMEVFSNDIEEGESPVFDSVSCRMEWGEEIILAHTLKEFESLLKRYYKQKPTVITTSLEDFLTMAGTKEHIEKENKDIV